MLIISNIKTLNLLPALLILLVANAVCADDSQTSKQPTTDSWHFQTSNSKIVLDLLINTWDQLDKSTSVQSDTHEKTSRQIRSDGYQTNWREQLSPPMPNVWPLTSARNLTYYAFAEYESMQRDYDSLGYSAPWAEVVLRDGHPAELTILRSNIGPAISGWCRGGLCLPGRDELGLEDRDSIFGHGTDKIQTLLSWTGLPQSDDDATRSVRRYYCRWQYEHKDWVTQSIANKHKEFFNWLACDAMGETVRIQYLALITALINGDKNEVKKMLGTGFDPASTSPALGISPLGAAVKSLNSDLFDLLIEYGATRRFNAMDWTMLLANASATGDIPFVKHVLKLGFKPDAIDAAISYATTDAMCDFFLSLDPHPAPHPSSQGRTVALGRAVAVGNTERIAYMLRHVEYSNATLRDNLVETLCPGPLFTGGAYREKEQFAFQVVRLLVAAGATAAKLPCVVRPQSPEEAQVLASIYGGIGK